TARPSPAAPAPGAGASTSSSASQPVRRTTAAATAGPLHRTAPALPRRLAYHVTVAPPWCCCTRPARAGGAGPTVARERSRPHLGESAHSGQAARMVEGESPRKELLDGHLRQVQEQQDGSGQGQAGVRRRGTEDQREDRRQAREARRHRSAAGRAPPGHGRRPYRRAVGLPAAIGPGPPGVSCETEAAPRPAAAGRPPARPAVRDAGTDVRNSPTQPSSSRPTSGFPPTFAVFGRGTSTWCAAGLMTVPGYRRLTRSSCDSRNSTGAKRMLLPCRTISPTPQARASIRR